MTGCVRCASTDDVKDVEISKVGGAVASPRGQLSEDIGKSALCAMCRERLVLRGYGISILRKAVVA